MNYRDTASFGKRQEYMAIAELLRLGYNVYQPLVDDQQIDCIVRLSSPKGPIYVDIQIKSRSASAKLESWGEWPSVKLEEPRQNFVFIFYSEPLKTTWVIPSLVIPEKGYRAPSMKDKPIYKIAFAKPRINNGEIVSRGLIEGFEMYIDAYSIIDDAAGVNRYNVGT